MSDFYEALPYQTKNKNVYKTQNDRLQDCLLHVTFGNIRFTFSNTCLLFVCLWLIKLMWQSIKQAYEMDRSDLQNEYWICSYKQLYEANLQYLKKNLLNLLFKNDSQLHVYMREKNRVSQLMLKERTREAASTSVTQPSCESLSFRQKEKQSLVAEICFALSLSFRTTSIYFHSIIYH